jgi:DNA-binding MarR family transcriptional regulator
VSPKEDLHRRTIDSFQPQIASPATLHRKLDELLELGLIQHEHEGKNRRTKYLKMSTAGRLYTVLMSQAMERAVQ